VLPFGAKQASAASESCLLLGLCCRSIRGGGGMKSEREKLYARKLTFANTEAFTQTERDRKTERKGSGGGEQKRMPAWRKIANIVENDVSTVGLRGLAVEVGVDE